MSIAREAGSLYSSSQQHCVRDQRSRNKGFEANAAERTTTMVQNRCYNSCSNIDTRHKLVHSEHSETTLEPTCNSGGGVVCGEGCRSSADSPATSCSSSCSAVISLQLQMQQLYSVCPYFLDSADILINLPDDLIRQVLRRISLREIVRMGCLNRSWRSEMQRLTTDDQFYYS